MWNQSFVFQITEPYSKPKYDRIFADLQPVNGKVSGSSAKNEMVKSKLPNSVRLFPQRLENLSDEIKHPTYSY